MRALLVVNKGGDKDLKVMVSLSAKVLIERVNKLIAQSKEREAFDFLLKNAEVEDFIPPGKKVDVKPDLTFIEDML